MDSAYNAVVLQALVVQCALLSGIWSSYQSLSASVPFSYWVGEASSSFASSPASESSGASAALPSAPPFSTA